MFMCKEKIVEIVKEVVDGIFGKKVRSELADLLGKKGKPAEQYWTYSWSGSHNASIIEEPEEKPTGVFKQIATLEQKVADLEKFLKINHVKEVQEFEGYKPVATPRKSKPKAKKRNR